MCWTRGAPLWHSRTGFLTRVARLQTLPHEISLGAPRPAPTTGRERSQLNNGDYSNQDRQEQSGMDRNRLISDAGVATGCDEAERALVNALVAPG